MCRFKMDLLLRYFPLLIFIFTQQIQVQCHFPFQHFYHHGHETYHFSYPGYPPPYYGSYAEKPPPTTDLKPLSVQGWETSYNVDCGSYTIHPGVVAHIRYNSHYGQDQGGAHGDHTYPFHTSPPPMSSTTTPPPPQTPYYLQPNQFRQQEEYPQLLQNQNQYQSTPQQPQPGSNQGQRPRPGGIRERRRYKRSHLYSLLLRISTDFLILNAPGHLPFCGSRKPRGEYTSPGKTIKLDFKSESALFPSVLDCTVTCPQFGEGIDDTSHPIGSTTSTSEASSEASSLIVIPSDDKVKPKPILGERMENCTMEKGADAGGKSGDKIVKICPSEDIKNSDKAKPKPDQAQKEESPKKKLKYGSCRCGISIEPPNDFAKSQRKPKVVISSRLPRNHNQIEEVETSKPTPEADGLHLERILGGTEAIPGTFSWTAALVRKKRSRPFCGASLINDRYLITAAHCILNHREGRGVEGEEIFFEVLLNEHDITKSNEIVEPGKEAVRAKVDKIIIHPNYQNRTYDHDIALIRLANRIPIQIINETESKGNKKSNIKKTESVVQIRPICLPKENSAFEGGNGHVSGWGLTREGGHPSNVMMSAQVHIFKSQECKTFYRGLDVITDAQICAGHPTQMIDSCVGDSGGPLVVDSGGHYVLAGIVSWGRGCGRPNFPGIYAKVGGVTDWILSETEDGVWCKEP